MKEWFEIELMIPGKEFRQRFYEKLKEFSNLSYRNAVTPWGDAMDMLITIKKKRWFMFFSSRLRGGL